MASIRYSAVVTAVSATLMLFCAGVATVKHRERVSTSASAQRQRHGVLNDAIVLIDDWDQVPAGGDSSTPAAASPAEVPAGPFAPAGDHPHRGPARAPVTIVEYSDFQCPYCRKAEPTVQQIRTEYGRKVRIVYMDFPLDFHPNAMDAALAARCAREQGQFWAYCDALLAGASGLSIPALKDLAGSLRLHTSSFDRCLDHRTYADAIESDIAEGRRSGVSGTPTFIINGRTVVGAPALPKFRKIIDASLAARAGI